MKKYNEDVKAFIADNTLGRTTRELVELTNAKFGPIFTDSKMKAYKSKYKLKSGMPKGVAAGSATNRYPNEISKFISENHIGIGPTEMAALLNNTFKTDYTPGQMKSYYGNHKIKSGITGYFEKGSIPFNKGKNGYYAPGSEKGWFQKGRMPKNHKPVGSERVDNKDGYMLVKTAEPRTWRPKHKLLWEAVNGPTPEKHMIIFLDGDKSNITLENLAMISMAEHLALTRSKLRSSNAEFTKTGILIAKIKVSRYKKKR